jgi:nickel/cobalt transporter (NiCoT) family protein
MAFSVLLERQEKQFRLAGPLHTSPHNFLALCLLVFVLGLRHGLDADHLATIDGLTRFNNCGNPRIARMCGLLFSVGHGVVVVAIAAVVSVLADQWHVPELLAQTGAWISIGFLGVLGAVNLAAALRAGDSEIVQPVGFKGRVFGRLNRVSRPAAVALVGVLFALSFDTVSQATLFAVMGTRFGGLVAALSLGLLFALGMVLVDGLNGLWVSRLLRRTDNSPVIASRVMGFAVGLLSLLVAAFGALKLLSRAFDNWSDGKELAFGFGVVGLVAAAFLFALALGSSAAIRPARRLNPAPQLD